MTDENKQLEVENENEKMVKVGELKRRINSEKEKYEKQISELVDKYEGVIGELQQPVKEKEEEVKFTSQELQRANERIADLEKKMNHRKLRDVAIDKLNEKGLPVNDTSLNFVVRSDEDETTLAVDKLRLLIDEQNEQYVEQYRRGKTPTQVNDHVDISKKQFDKMSLVEKSELYEQNEELYNKLSKGE